MSIFESILLGIIQGIFMFFPVSSTSHLVLTQHWLIERGSSIPAPESPEMIFFDLIVHVGTLVSIAVVFRKSLGRFLFRVWQDVISVINNPKSFPRKPLTFKLFVKENPSLSKIKQDRRDEKLYLRLALLGMLSVFVTGLIGFPLKSVFKEVFATPGAIAVTLSITGILLWYTDMKLKQPRGLRKIDPFVATIIGIGQGLALIPGLSRSGMTISFALFVGLKRQWAAEYSFFIAFPTILGATLLQLIEISQADTINLNLLPLTIGFIVSAIVGVFALQIVLNFLYRAKFRYFSFYLWILAIIVAFGMGSN
ncbi:Undecaprenyl-diphosphatase [Cyanobacterium stanieri PCC 7202]|uniref:Undecaprenyl-diphosphatase n=1 Tax=Cyanobacterium stanieri (strain ATCC 29140 / PCC 7202) TaxID=292563 RepID=K9YN57_CYASC|nr:Undecaprenyl-diphosphatase [Cyanobacterium stanieri PCC 7202]